MPRWQDSVLYFLPTAKSRQCDKKFAGELPDPKLPLIPGHETVGGVAQVGMSGKRFPTKLLPFVLLSGRIRLGLASDLTRHSRRRMAKVRLSSKAGLQSSTIWRMYSWAGLVTPSACNLEIWSSRLSFARCNPRPTPSV